MSPPPWDDKHVVLIGLMGAGKTSVGAVLADRLGRPFVDLDDEVVAMCGESVPEIFERHGEDGFRARERDALQQILARPEPVVLAAGGGIVERIDNQPLLRRRAWVVWLRVSPEEAWTRVGGDGNRPLLGDDPLGSLRALEQQRRSRYRLTAHRTVRADRPVAEIVDDIAVSRIRDSVRTRRLAVIGLMVITLALVITLLQLSRSGESSAPPELAGCASSADPDVESGCP